MLIVNFLFICILTAALIKGRQDPKYRILAGGMAGLACVWLLTRLLSTPVPAGREMEFRFYEAAGFGIGREVSREFPQGGTFAVLSLSGRSQTRSVYDAEFEGLKKALTGDTFTLVVLDLERLGDSLDGVLNRLYMSQETPELWDLVLEIPGVDGWISLEGQPIATRQEHFDIPLVFVNSSGQPSTWQSNTRLEFKVKPLLPSQVEASSSASLEELFAMRYDVLKDQ